MADPEDIGVLGRKAEAGLGDAEKEIWEHGQAAAGETKTAGVDEMTLGCFSPQMHSQTGSVTSEIIPGFCDARELAPGNQCHRLPICQRDIDSAAK